MITILKQWSSVKVGDVLNVGETVKIVTRDERIMSDVWDYCSYAVNFDGTKISEVYIGCGHDGKVAEAVVDASPATIAAYEAFVANAAREAEERRLQAEAEREANTIRKGKTVRVVRGRKIAKGTEGRVFWYGQTQFGMRVGIELANGTKEFTAASNVEVAEGALAVA